MYSLRYNTAENMLHSSTYYEWIMNRKGIIHYKLFTDWGKLYVIKTSASFVNSYPVTGCFFLKVEDMTRLFHRALKAYSFKSN